MLNQPNNRHVRIFAAITLGVVVFLGLLWWTGPHMEQHEGACIPASLIGSDCPDIATSLALSSHAGALRQFTEVTVAGQPIFLTVFLMLAVFGFLLTIGNQFASPAAFVARQRSREHWRVPEQLRFTHWLALHEISPSLTP